MAREKELQERLLAKMTAVIREAKHLPNDEAERVAAEAHRQMEDEIRRRRDRMKQRLMQLQKAALSEIGPDFNKPEYQHLFDRISERILRAFESYAGTDDKRRI